MSISLADAIFWIAVACCSVAQLAIMRSVIVSPARDQSVAHRASEIAWAILPGVALAFVFVATWHAMHESNLAAQVGSLLSSRGQ